jgi:hypothetical protein
MTNPRSDVFGILVMKLAGVKLVEAACKSVRLKFPPTEGEDVKVSKKKPDRLIPRQK